MSHLLLLSAVLDHPWAISERMRPIIAETLARHLVGRTLSAEDMQAALAQRAKLPQPGSVTGGIAVIPVNGVLAPFGNVMTETSGMSSLDVLTSQLRAAVISEAVQTIVLHVNSPGGSVAGGPEFVSEVLKARKRKPLVAQIEYTGASLAYWIAGACTEVVAAPSALLGSVGAFQMHDDLRKALAAEGVERTIIRAGEFKAEGNSFEELTPEAAARIQARCDATLDLFHADLAKGRGVSLAKVRSDFGRGALLSAQQALDAGMIDRIATLDDTIRRIGSGERPALAAADDTPAVLVEEPAPTFDRTYAARIGREFLKLQLR